MSDFHWSIDTLLLNHDLIFGYGWAFHERYDIISIRLVVSTHEDEIMTVLPVEHGKLRPDVEEAFGSNPRTLRSGFSIYQSITAHDNILLSLEVSLSNNETVTMNIPSTIVTRLKFNNSYSGKFKQVGHLLSKSLRLLREGKISTFVRKARQYTQGIPQSSTGGDILRILDDTEASNVTLVIDHDMGGGANLYTDRLASEQIRQGRTVLILSYHVGSLSYVLSIKNGRQNARYALSGVREVLDLAKLANVKEIIYNNAVSFPVPEQIPQFIIGLKSLLKCSLVVNVHDYFMVCPSPHLINSDGKFCEIPDINKCETCLISNKQSFVSLFASKDMKMWRKLWGMVLQSADQIVIFSKSSETLLRKAYPTLDLDKVVLRPHEVDVALEQIDVTDTNQLQIGVVGQIGFHKGAEFLRTLAEEIRQRGISTKITIIGSIDSLYDRSIISETGSYQRDRLAELIKKSHSNVMLFPSICPETFSFVTHELIGFELPIACFPVGAQMERIQTYPKGLVLKNYDAVSVLDELISFHNKIYLRDVD